MQVQKTSGVNDSNLPTPESMLAASDDMHGRPLEWPTASSKVMEHNMHSTFEEGSSMKMERSSGCQLRSYVQSTMPQSRYWTGLQVSDDMQCGSDIAEVPSAKLAVQKRDATTLVPKDNGRHSSRHSSKHTFRIQGDSASLTPGLNVQALEKTVQNAECQAHDTSKIRDVQNKTSRRKDRGTESCCVLTGRKEGGKPMADDMESTSFNSSPLKAGLRKRNSTMGNMPNKVDSHEHPGLNTAAMKPQLQRSRVAKVTSDPELPVTMPSW
jgi:hypothetical protein